MKAIQKTRTNFDSYKWSYQERLRLPQEITIFSNCTLQVAPSGNQQASFITNPRHRVESNPFSIRRFLHGELMPWMGAAWQQRLGRGHCGRWQWSLWIAQRWSTLALHRHTMQRKWFKRLSPAPYLLTRLVFLGCLGWQKFDGNARTKKIFAGPGLYQLH